MTDIKEGSIWLVEFPTYRYKEDVKDLAARNRLRIINAKFKDRFDEKYIASKQPKLTLKPEYAPAKAE